MTAIQAEPGRVTVTFGPTFWAFNAPDLPWLYEEFEKRSSQADRRLLLNAITTILHHAGQLEAEEPNLRQMIGNWAILNQDLEEALAPPPVRPSRRFDTRTKKQKREQAEAEQSAKASWQKFSEYLRANLGQLRDPKLLSSWETGAFRLHELTRWLGFRTRERDADGASLQWRLLEEAFGREVAEGYRDGMKLVWRVVQPERPRYEGNGRSTTKHITVLAFRGIDIEAAEDPDWISRLSDREVRTAALHGCLSEQGYPTWLDALVAAHPGLTVPVVKRAVAHEWKGVGATRTDLLYHFSGSNVLLETSLQSALVDVIGGPEPPDLNKLDRGIRLAVRLELSTRQTKRLTELAEQRLWAHGKKGQVEHALRHLALLFVLQGDKAVDTLNSWLKKPKKKERKALAEQTFGFLFDRHHPAVPGVVLGEMSVSGLQRLLRTAYIHVHPSDDLLHEGMFEPGLRDSAESARSAILSALLERWGEEAYRALQRIARDPDFSFRRERFHQLARGKAERESELPAWTAAEVLNFERARTAPVKTGADLLHLVMGVLQDIQLHMDKGDVTSRPLLQRAQDEDEARNYLVEQMNFRSRGRFHAYREAQIARKNRPDIIIASAAAQCEVGMEVKHGAKTWTLPQLETALQKQLANGYLNPATRRHGVFVITNHGPRRWRSGKALITFKELIERLSKIARNLRENDSGPIQVRCFGVDASGPL
jgi:hypothetical protein